MQRAVALATLSVVASLFVPPGAQSQTWPEIDRGESGLTWVIGAYAPMAGLGSFADYRVVMDPWPMVGLSLQPGSDEDRFRSRFEIMAVPNVAMRRHPLREPAAACEECTPDSFRLTLLNSRFLMDLTFPFVSDSRAYLTGGPAVRFQLSDPEACPASAGSECALPQFARSRLDPGVVTGVGWEPASSTIQAIQLTGRISVYGRGEREAASPNRWLPELDLVIRFSF